MAAVREVLLKGKVMLVMYLFVLALAPLQTLVKGNEAAHSCNKLLHGGRTVDHSLCATFGCSGTESSTSYFFPTRDTPSDTNLEDPRYSIWNDAGHDSEHLAPWLLCLPVMTCFGHGVRWTPYKSLIVLRSHVYVSGSRYLDR